jgi:Glyoxalase superfamily protein
MDGVGRQSADPWWLRFRAFGPRRPMRDFRDANAMAQTLREALKTKSVSLTHSESSELVARILGFHD